MAKPAISLDVPDFAAIDAAMKELQADIQLKVMRSALRESAKPPVRAAKANLQRTGTASSDALAASIGIKKRTDRNATKTIAYLVGPIENDKGAAAQYRSFYGRGGSGIYHGHLLEFGTKHSNERRWLRPAIDSTYQESIAVFSDQMKRKIKRAAAKADARSKKR